MNSIKPLIPKNAVEIAGHEYHDTFDKKEREPVEMIWYKQHQSLFDRPSIEILVSKFQDGTMLFLKRANGNTNTERTYYVVHPKPASPKPASPLSIALKPISEYFKQLRQAWA